MDASLNKTFENVKKSTWRIEEYIHKTPLLTSSTINEETGLDVYFKAENQQKSGSFKARGAAYAVISGTNKKSRPFSCKSLGCLFF